MEENERMKLAIRVAYNHLKIAIEQGREHGLNPRLLVRTHFHGEPIYQEPRFGRDALVKAGPEWDYEIFTPSDNIVLGWYPFEDAESMSDQEIQGLLNEGIIRKVLKAKVRDTKHENMILDDTEDVELTPSQKATIERFYHENLIEKMS